jgi:putative addiction module killer protein
MEIRKTEHYVKWEAALRDKRALAHVAARIRRLSLGNAGDAQPVGEGVSEMRIHYGPGYRVYYKKTGTEIVILLVGGTKGTQSADIALAKRLASSI